MNATDRDDTAQKIAEIREDYKSERDDNFTYKKEIVEQDIRFLLSELERLEREYAEERAAHNAHVTELCELQQERNMYKSSSEVFYERLKIRDELLEQLCAQIKYYFGGDGGLAKLQDGVNKLLQERQKLIDGLLTIMNIASEDGVHWKLDRCYTTARNILKEIGVLSK